VISSPSNSPPFSSSPAPFSNRFPLPAIEPLSEENVLRQMLARTIYISPFPPFSLRSFSFIVGLRAAYLSRIEAGILFSVWASANRGELFFPLQRILRRTACFFRTKNLREFDLSILPFSLTVRGGGEIRPFPKEILVPVGDAPPPLPECAPGLLHHGSPGMISCRWFTKLSLC